MPTIHLKVVIDGSGTICNFLDAAVEAASDAVAKGTASVFWKTEAECGWQTEVSGEDHIKAIINSPGALKELHKNRPAKRLKLGQSSSSLEAIQSPPTPDGFELGAALDLISSSSSSTQSREISSSCLFLSSTGTLSST